VFLFGLGVAIIALNTEMPYGLIAGLVLLLCVVAGLLEAAAIRQSGRRRRIGSWLPAVVGLFAAMAVQHMQWKVRFGATAPPDAGMAMGLAIAAFLFSVPIVGVLVNVLAALAARLVGPIPPVPASPWPHASLELLNVLGRNAWMPLAHSAAAAGLAVAILLLPLDVVPQVLPACAMADGMLAIITAVLSHDRSEARWWPAYAGLIGIGAGILSLVWEPGMLVLIVLVCIWGVASGLFLVSGANRLRALRSAQFVRLAGLASLTLGVGGLYLLFALTI
jgi:hypothetical protein